MSLPPFSIRVIPRTLKFKQPAGTSRGVYTERRVWYIVISSATSAVRFTGLGECAPLHDLSCDFSADYDERLRAVCREVERTQSLDNARWRHLPSMLFGLQTAFRSAQGSLHGDYRLLWPSAFTRGQRGIPINGLVWMGSFDEMAARMERKLEQGFRCVKLKIGAIDFDSELQLIRRLRSRFSPADVELRVDANGGFSPSEAPRRLEALARFGIHSIEQPIRQGQWAEMAALCRQTPLPIALDEELIGVNDREEKATLLDNIRPQYVVLKPSLHGAFTGAEEWMTLARERGIGYWTTSALESNVGLNAIAQWCAATDGHSPLPQGLGTGQLFVRNFDAAPLRIEGDCLWYGAPEQRTFRKELEDFTARWRDDRPTLTVHTSGSTGQPRPMEAEKARMVASARATISALGLQRGDTALLAMPLRFIAGQMVVVRSLVGDLQLIPVAPSSHPLASLHEAPVFAALTPMQVYESLKVPHECRLLRAVRQLIIGGGSIAPELAAALRRFPHAVWSTYGMTETLSHIALRRLNGSTADDAYTPLQGVAVALSGVETLVVIAPAICAEPIVTNDIAELLPDGRFRLRGRRDNVVCSGGLKFQLEELEAKLSRLTVPFILTAVPDSKYGEALTLLYIGSPADAVAIEQHCRQQLTRYEVPKHFLAVASLPLTPTGKPARARARAVAIELTNKQQ